MQMVSFTLRRNNGEGPSYGKEEERINKRLGLLSFEAAKEHPSVNTK